VIRKSFDELMAYTPVLESAAQNLGQLIDQPD